MQVRSRLQGIRPELGYDSTVRVLTRALLRPRSAWVARAKALLEAGGAKVAELDWLLSNAQQFAWGPPECCGPEVAALLPRLREAKAWVAQVCGPPRGGCCVDAWRAPPGMPACLPCSQDVPLRRLAPRRAPCLAGACPMQRSCHGRPHRTAPAGCIVALARTHPMRQTCPRARP